ncbi:hypothetical protein Avbf_17350, partial [Armadillidium vulgare]
MRQNEALHQNTTVIFVTFDIDTRNYIPSGPGKPGSFSECRKLIGSSGYEANFLAVFSRPDKANQKEVERLIWTNEE